MMMTIPVEESVKRLKTIRDKITVTNQTRARVLGELGTHKKRQVEIEKECLEKFDIGIKDVEVEIQRLKDEADKHIAKAEKLLVTDQEVREKEEKQCLDMEI